jgi:hypothetical protein
MNIKSLFESKLAAVAKAREEAKAKAEQAKAEVTFLADAAEVGLDWEAGISRNRVKRIEDQASFLRKKGEVLKAINDGEEKILSIVEGLEKANCLPSQLDSLQLEIADKQEATNELLKDLNLL